MAALLQLEAEANAASASFPEMFKDEVKEAPAKPKGRCICVGITGTGKTYGIPFHSRVTSW